MFLKKKSRKRVQACAHDDDDAPSADVVRARALVRAACDDALAAGHTRDALASLSGVFRIPLVFESG